jgi:hypothetical protein
MRTVYFFIQGQFANNLFQYFAAEMIRKIYGYDEVKPTFTMNLEFNNVIDDVKFKQIITRHIRGETVDIDGRRDILLLGFFQRSEIFKFERKYVRGLFRAENMSHISNRIQIGNIVKYQSKHTEQPTESDLVLHLRCGDFWDHEKHRSQIYHPTMLKQIISTIKYDKLYIVSSPADFDWEKEYYQQFEELNPVWIHGNLGDDFDFLMKAKKIITSASTLSWMAAYLGNAKEVHIPYNNYYGGFEGCEQSLADFSDHCKVYYDVDYWLPPSKKASS